MDIKRAKAEFMESWALDDENIKRKELERIYKVAQKHIRALYAKKSKRKTIKSEFSIGTNTGIFEFTLSAILYCEGFEDSFSIYDGFKVKAKNQKDKANVKLAEYLEYMVMDGDLENDILEIICPSFARMWDEEQKGLDLVYKDIDNDSLLNNIDGYAFLDTIDYVVGALIDHDTSRNVVRNAMKVENEIKKEMKVK
jgi:hypothetical protein